MSPETPNTRITDAPHTGGSFAEKYFWGSIALHYIFKSIKYWVNIITAEDKTS